MVNLLQKSICENSITRVLTKMPDFAKNKSTGYNTFLMASKKRI
jgi:hypothetical protein